MEVNCINKNGELLAFFTFFDHKTRNSEVTEYHKKVTSFYNIPWNYIEIDYRQINHGQAIESVLRSFGNNIQYFAFFDNDCIPLVKNIDEIIYNKIKDKITLFGGIQNSNHIHGKNHHPFIAPSSFCISSELYKNIGMPHLGDLISRSDHTEEATFKCQEFGYNVSFVYPVKYFKLTSEEMQFSGNPESWELQNGNGFDFRYGLGTNYGNLFFHAMMQNLPRSNEIFINKCKEILREGSILNKLEAVITCVGYSKFLEITLEENINYFDHIVIVTTPNDLETQRLVNKYSEKVTCVTTNRFYDRGAKFDKGGAINEGLKLLKYDSFVCHLDVDIVLPRNFREILDLNKLDINTLYGGRRFFVDTYKDWVDFKNGIKNKNDFTGLQWGGWGCGFFQIWNMNSNKIKHLRVDNLYPSYPTAAESDILMLKRFHPNVLEVGKLDIDVVHLGNSGVNHDTTDSNAFFLL